MLHLQTRLSPCQSDLSRQSRRYSLDLCQHAIALALQIGVRAAANDTGIPYRRLVRLVCAHRRSTQTLEEALNDLGRDPIMTTSCGDRGYPMPWVAEAQAKKKRAALLIRAEAAREGVQIAQRTGANVWKCIALSAERRGLRGKGVVELVREGRIPLHWIQ